MKVRCIESHSIYFEKGEIYETTCKSFNILSFRIVLYAEADTVWNARRSRNKDEVNIYEVVGLASFVYARLEVVDESCMC